MQKIIPHLWFDTQAKEAAEFYISIFPESEFISSVTLHNTPSNDAEYITFRLWGFEFQAISAGPFFKPNPSISFMLNFDPSKDPEAATRLEEVWNKLEEGGKVLMPIDKYDFSEKYGWVEDKYGFSWQLILTNPNGEERPNIIPSLLFTEDAYGKAEEATNFYIDVFRNSKRGMIAKYPAGMEHDKEGATMFTDFMLEGQWFAAMDSGYSHGFSFNEAISFIVSCEDQEEADYYWDKLSAVPESEQCGWIKDKYGVSWQIVPKELDKMMFNGTQEQIDRVTQVLLPMKKLDMKKLKEAYDGNE